LPWAASEDATQAPSRGVATTMATHSALKERPTTRTRAERRASLVGAVRDID
jgi:hypothetical protein